MSAEVEAVKSNVKSVEQGLMSKMNHLEVRMKYQKCGIFNFLKRINPLLQENINGTHTFPATCQEYHAQGNRVNGLYKIRPNIELHAFTVECEFTEDKGITYLQPNDWRETGYIFPETENQRCNEANCFSHNFKYGASDDQIHVSSKNK